jgi:hypothetical protein
MKFQPGDKVSFINEKQDGVVTKSSPGGRVTVRIEDGFEIDVLEKELVKTGNVKVEQAQIQEVIAETNDETFLSVGEIVNMNTIALVTVPEAIGAVLSGPVQFYLVNKSSYDVLYTCYLSYGKDLKGKSAGSISSGDNILLLSSGRNDLFGSGPFQIELLLYSQNQKPQVSHIRKEVPLSLPDLTNTNSQGKSRLGFGKVSLLLDENQPEEIQIKDLVEKWNDPKPAEKSTSKTPNKSGHVYFVNEKTVDLHIEELMENFSGMNNAEILSVQMKRFDEEMHEAIRKNFKRIIFIHGIGKGVLKQSILNELKNYKGIRVREADPVKYGQGATEVLF